MSYDIILRVCLPDTSHYDKVHVKCIPIICFTGTATGTVPTSVLSYSDYISRPEEHNSVLRFDKGEKEKMCRVVIIDDSLYEEAESFNVTLSMPMGGRLGSEFPSTKVVISPDKDDGKDFYTLFKGFLHIGGNATVKHMGDLSFPVM